jgi:mono/diheme cytochrome c family protein
MNRSTLCLLLLAFVGASTSACGPKAGAAPGPLSMASAELARSRWPDASVESLEQGRQLFLTNCHRCHSYPDRTAYTAEEWPSLVRRMGRKAHLSDAEAMLVLRFVLTDREARSGASSR